MSQTPITVSYDIKELFINLERKIDQKFERVDEKFENLEEKIDQRFEKIDQRFEKIESGQAEIKNQVTALTVEVEAIKKDIGEIKGSQRNQIWALITIIGGAVVTGSVVAVWRTFLISSP
ncbi:MAG: hypothetical protein N5P05_001323 [Chroococcopsis gigantea SAG 12.99]|nr:hypothetical protein [Chroococcopsis gigantea SAG 12.99]